MDVTEAEHKIY